MLWLDALMQRTWMVLVCGHKPLCMLYGSLVQPSSVLGQMFLAEFCVCAEQFCK